MTNSESGIVFVFSFGSVPSCVSLRLCVSGPDLWSLSRAQEVGGNPDAAV